MATVFSERRGVLLMNFLELVIENVSAKLAKNQIIESPAPAEDFKKLVSRYQKCLKPRVVVSNVFQIYLKTIICNAAI